MLATNPGETCGMLLVFSPWTLDDLLWEQNVCSFVAFFHLKRRHVKSFAYATSCLVSWMTTGTFMRSLPKGGGDVLQNPPQSHSLKICCCFSRSGKIDAAEKTEKWKNLEFPALDKDLDFGEFVRLYKSIPEASLVTAKSLANEDLNDNGNREDVGASKVIQEKGVYGPVPGIVLFFFFFFLHFVFVLSPPSFLHLFFQRLDLRTSDAVPQNILEH